MKYQYDGMEYIWPHVREISKELLLGVHPVQKPCGRASSPSFKHDRVVVV